MNDVRPARTQTYSDVPENISNREHLHKTYQTEQRNKIGCAVLH